MKKLILLIAVIASFTSCKKEEITPDNQLAGTFRLSHVYCQFSNYSSGQPNNTIDQEIPISDQYQTYFKFSNVTNNSADMAEYTYGDFTDVNYRKVIISGNKISWQEIDLTQNVIEYSVNATTLITTQKINSPEVTVLSTLTLSRVSSLPIVNGGSGCQSVQCSATASSTGKRCLHMTTNCNGRCWQHQ